jgi:hypothetical protein
MAVSISISNPPHIENVQNNTGSNDLRFLNYRFYLKTMVKKAACFRYSGNKCNATISLKNCMGPFIWHGAWGWDLSY